MLPLPEILRRLRRQAGLTQVELAQQAGVSQPTISNIEKHGAIPALDVYVALVQAMGLDVDWTPRRRASEAGKKLALATAMMSEETLDRLARLAMVLDGVPPAMLEGMIHMASERQTERRSG